MRIKSIALQNFRNHKSTVLNLSPGINVLVGDNAQGKTNLLEAIFLTCVGRGFRSPRDREMIKFDENIARVKTIAAKKFGDISVEVTISAVPGRAGKQIKINDIPIAKMGELMGSVTCVFFSPDELRLIKEAPSDRRRFMDIDISQMDKVYFYNLLRYNKILQQRNALLKSMGPGADELRALDIWDEQLAKVGGDIIERRIVFCEELKKCAASTHPKLAPGERIEITYDGIAKIAEIVPRGTISGPANVGAGPVPAPTILSGAIWADTGSAPTNGVSSCSGAIGSALLDALHVARVKDLRLRTTTVGPHRDDLAITVNGKDVRSFASQGQQRTVALSLKLAELKIFEDMTGEKPVLLLDDVFSELDSSRQAKLLDAIKDCQCIITTTRFVPRAGVRVFNIKNGGLCY